jgi:hypothetical protein
MALTYGMIGDRLSDLVAELREINEDGLNNQKASELSNFISILDSLRSTCDALSLKGLTDAIAARDGS